MHDAVFSAAYHYPVKDIAPFVSSLRSVFDGFIFLIITGKQKEDFFDLAKSNQVNLVISEVAQGQMPHTNRYFDYRSILRSQHKKIKRIFLADSRDIIFQKSPFSDKDGCLQLFAEPFRIGDCVVNSRWIKRYYEEEFLNQIKHELIICSGTTLGSVEWMDRYLGAMCDQIGKFISDGRKMDIGDDQAFHNYLYYSGQLSGALLGLQGYSEVQTLHYEKRFNFDRSCRLLNRDGSIVPVIHQYDRFPQFFPLFNTMLANLSQNSKSNSLMV